MSPKAIVPLVAGLCIGGLALKLGWSSLHQAQGAQTPTVSVWAAKEDIPRGTTIREEMLQLLSFPAKSLPQGAIKEKEKDKLLGRVPRITAPGSLPILEPMLLAPGERAGITGQVKPGFRAVAVKVDESSCVDYHLEPGSFVDVVGFFTDRRNGKQDTVARTLLENVEVAAVGERINASDGPSADDKKKGGGSSNAKPARAVTLFVKPQDVPLLHLAEQKGKIKLSLRGKQDETTVGFDTSVMEDRLLGPAKEEEKKAQEGQGFLSKLLTSGKKPEPAAPAARVEPPPLKMAWTMKLVQGDATQVLGWLKLDSMESIELSREKGRGTSGKRNSAADLLVPPHSKSGAGRAPVMDFTPAAGQPNNPTATPNDGGDVEPQGEPNPEPEPEELHE